MSRRHTTHRSRPVRLQRRNGVLAPVDAGFWWELWRDPNHLLLAAPWPVFLAMITLAYLAINLTFAGLYLLFADGIGGVEGGGPATFADAFFFSVQTLGSIGYGVLHPTTLPVNILVSVQALLGLLFIALTTGLAFSRFSRTVARIRFSSLATVDSYNGLPTLMFRLANERRNSILDGRLKLFLALDEYSSEGDRMRSLIPMALKRAEGIVFMRLWTAMHPIDEQSPLHGLSADDLVAARAEILVSFSGVDETLERPINARHNYPVERIAFGRRFVDMVESESDQVTLHFERFDDTEPGRHGGT
jgi:inward rectifier potassium channel